MRRPARPSSKVICLPNSYGLGKSIALAILDVSETGAKLRLREAVRVKQEVQIGLMPPGHTREFKLNGVVVWCEPAGDGTFLVGIHFDKLLTYSVVQDLGRLSTL